MTENMTPGVLEMLADEYDGLGMEASLDRNSLDTPTALWVREPSRSLPNKWRLIASADLDLVGEADEAARYRAVVGLEAEAAWRSQ